MRRGVCRHARMGTASRAPSAALPRRGRQLWQRPSGERHLAGLAAGPGRVGLGRWRWREGEEEEEREQHAGSQRRSETRRSIERRGRPRRKSRMPERESGRRELAGRPGRGAPLALNSSRGACGRLAWSAGTQSCAAGGAGNSASGPVPGAPSGDRTERGGGGGPALSAPVRGWRLGVAAPLPSGCRATWSMAAKLSMAPLMRCTVVGKAACAASCRRAPVGGVRHDCFGGASGLATWAAAAAWQV